METKYDVKYVNVPECRLDLKTAKIEPTKTTQNTKVLIHQVHFIVNAVVKDILANHVMMQATITLIVIVETSNGIYRKNVNGLNQVRFVDCILYHIKIMK